MSASEEIQTEFEKPARRVKTPTWLSEIMFYAAVMLAGGSLGLVFLRIERREAGLISLALAGLWAGWAYFFQLRKQPPRFGNGLSNLFFAGLVTLASWSVVSAAGWWASLVCLAASLAAWDMQAFLERTAHLRFGEQAKGQDWAALQRSHLRIIGITLGSGILIALLSLALAAAVRLQAGVWLILGLSAASTLGLIWLARVVLFRDRRS